MNRLLFTFLLFCFGSLSGLAQSVGIGATEFDVAPSAILEIRSNSKGILIPRMTAEERSAISTPEEGLLIYQTNDDIGFYYFTLGKWQPLKGNSSIINSVSKGYLLEGSVDNPTVPPTDLNSFTKKYTSDNGDKRDNFNITTDRIIQPTGGGRYGAWAFPKAWGKPKVYVSQNNTNENDFNLLYDCWRIFNGIQYQDIEYTVYIIDIDLFTNNNGLFFQFK